MQLQRGFWNGFAFEQAIAGLNFSKPLISPNRKYLAFLVNIKGDQIHIFDYSTTKVWQLTYGRPLSTGTPYGGGVYCWSSDSKHLFFSSKGEIYKIAVNGGTAKKVGSISGKAFEPYEVDELLVFSIESEDTMHLGLRNPEGWISKIPVAENFLYDAKIHPNTKDILVHAWSFPNMSWNGSKILLLEKEKNYQAKLIAGGKQIAVSQPSFSPDGKFMAFHSDESGWLNLWIADANGANSFNLINKKEEHAYSTWVTGAKNYAWSPDSSHIIYTKIKNGSMSLSLVEINTKRIIDLDVEVGYYGDLSIAEEQTLVCSFSNHKTRAEIQLIQYKLDGQVKSDSFVVSGIKFSDEVNNLFIKPKEYVFPTSDGKEAYSMFYALPDENGEVKNCPTIFFIHGGPTGMVLDQFKLEINYWVAKGWAVCAVNHRGSIGYGRKYRESLNGKWGVYDVSDTLDAFKSLQASGKIDADKCAIMGGSAGGYTTLMFLSHHSGVMKAGINLFGVADLFGLSEETHFLESQYDDSLIGQLPSASEKFFSQSPVYVADRIVDPLLILQGEDDPVVLKNQSDAIAKSVKGKVEYKVYKGEGHGFQKLESLQDMYPRIEKFLKMHVLYNRPKL